MGYHCRTCQEGTKLIPEHTEVTVPLRDVTPRRAAVSSGVSGASAVSASTAERSGPLLIELVLRLVNIAHMGLRPGAEWLDGGPQGTAQPGQLVVYARRDGGEDGPGHEAVAF